jgi:uncharacterized membrane protein
MGYAAIEIIWRGRTHWSMMIAGGLCFVFFSIAAELFSGRSIFIKAGAAALCVTAIELIFGVIFNIWLGMNVWDYSNVPMNFLGQICPIYSILWAGIAILFMPFVELLNKEYA